MLIHAGAGLWCYIRDTRYKQRAAYKKQAKDPREPNSEIDDDQL